MIRWKDAAFTVHVGVSSRDSVVSHDDDDDDDDDDDLHDHYNDPWQVIPDSVNINVSKVS